MRDFNKVAICFWQQPNRGLSDEAQYLRLYLMTCPHQNSAGAFSLPEGYACADLNWPLAKLRTHRKALIDANVLLFDADTNELFLVDWFTHNPAMNPKHIAGANRIIARLHSATIRDAAQTALTAQIQTAPPTPPSKLMAIHNR